MLTEESRWTEFFALFLPLALTLQSLTAPKASTSQTWSGWLEADVSGQTETSPRSRKIKLKKRVEERAQTFQERMMKALSSQLGPKGCPGASGPSPSWSSCNSVQERRKWLTPRLSGLLWAHCKGLSFTFWPPKFDSGMVFPGSTLIFNLLRLDFR